MAAKRRFGHPEDSEREFERQLKEALKSVRFHHDPGPGQKCMVIRPGTKEGWEWKVICATVELRAHGEDALREDYQQRASDEEEAWLLEQVIEEALYRLEHDEPRHTAPPKRPPWE